MASDRDTYLSYLQPIWKAAGWDLNKLKRKETYVLRGIYLDYMSKPQKVQEIMNKNKKSEWKQLSMFEEVV